MIIQQIEYEETISLGDIDTINSGIDVNSLPFVYDLVSSRLYRDSIGSIVREITSNCVDTHAEAKQEAPIIVNVSINPEDSVYYIEFIDKGLGINEEKFENIYMKWFSSTKRLSNKFIGSWGIGSKSPLSYTDYFSINTVVDGYEYKYILSKSYEGPILEKVSKLPSTAQTGTTIKIDIKSYDDKEKFFTAISQQLSYFDKVYVKCPFDSRIDNNYRLYDANTYRYRSGTPFTEMHILIGTVVYPIDWKLIGIKPVKVPVGIKFDIGVLNITPSREDIEYREETKELILERIELVKQELITQFNNQNPEIEDLREFLIKRNEKPCITFGDRDKLDIQSLGVSNSAIYSPLKNIGELPFNLFFEYELKTIRNGIATKSSRIQELDVNTVQNRLQGTYYSEQLAKYNNIFINNGEVILPRELSFKELTNRLKIGANLGFLHWKSWYSRAKDGDKPRLGIAKLVLQYRKVIREYLTTHSLSYPEVSEQWIKEYKESQAREDETKRRRLNKIILVYDSTNRRVEIKVSELERSKKVFYLIKEDGLSKFGYESKVDNILRCESLLNKRYKPFKYKDELTNTKKEVPLYKFIIINKTNFTQIKNLSNLVPIEEFFKTPELQKLFNKFVVAYNLKIFNEKATKFRLYNYSDYYFKKLEELRRYVDIYYPNSASQLIDYLRQIPVKNHICTWEIRQVKKELERFIVKADILQYIDYNTPENHIKTIVKTIHINKLNENLYDNHSNIQTDRTEPQPNN